jgi:hypothetical protein
VVFFEKFSQGLGNKLTTKELAFKSASLLVDLSAQSSLFHGWILSILANFLKCRQSQVDKNSESTQAT